jgi:hypothetical protein
MYPFYSFASQVEVDSFKDYISYKLGSNLLLIDPEIARKAKITYESGSKEISNVSLQLGTQKVSISFSSGPSEDPTFIISLGNKEEQLGGDKLYVSSSGFLYLVKRSNEHFEKHLKYALIDGNLKEIRQPLYLVDMKCETSTSLVMYEDKCNQGNLIAQLPQNTTVHILAMDNAPIKCDTDIVPDNKIHDQINNYLVATPFGLVGWVVSTRGYLHFRPGKPLGCLRFYGD